MTERQHHLLCLGTLALIYNGLLSKADIQKATEQAVASAQQLGLPVSVNALKQGLGIGTDSGQSFDSGFAE